MEIGQKMSATHIEISSILIDQIRCPTCGMTCLQKNIYRHVTQMHNWGPEECKNLVEMIRDEKKSRESKTSFACAYCRALFKSCRHLVQHKKICPHNPHLDPNGHPEMEDMFIDDMIVEGDSEMHQYTVNPDEGLIVEEEVVKPSTSSPSESHVYAIMGPPHRHTARPIQNHHLAARPPRIPPAERQIKYPSSKAHPATFSRQRGTHLKCPECPSSAECLDDFIAHCHEKHISQDRQFVVERRQFGSVGEFKKWFDQRQEDTCTSLTKRTGHGGETLYRCHRVGKYRSVAKSRKSNPRKVDQTCTAYLKVTTEDNGVTWATGCFTHIGHDLDHKLLWLTETQENYVRELIDLGWTSDQIFFYIRNEYKDYDCKLKYVSKNDIRNITVRYNRLKESQGELPVSSIRPKSYASQKYARLREQEDNEENLAENLASIENDDVLVPDDDDDEEEEEQVIKMAKIPRVEEPLTPRESEEHEEEVTSEVVIEDVTDMIVVEEAPEEAPESIVPAEEEEYINVVDDDSMPELERVDA